MMMLLMMVMMVEMQVRDLELVVIIILGCVLWNIIAFFTFAKRMFPNFWSVTHQHMDEMMMMMVVVMMMLFLFLRMI
jgi:Kef-type K+ transport system membrane component KefB